MVDLARSLAGGRLLALALLSALLAETIGSLTRDTLLQMARRARSLAKPDAARVAADACAELSGAGAA